MVLFVHVFNSRSLGMIDELIETSNRTKCAQVFRRFVHITFALF